MARGLAARFRQYTEIITHQVQWINADAAEKMCSDKPLAIQRTYYKKLRAASVVVLLDHSHVRAWHYRS